MSFITFLYSGVGGILVMGVGIIISGIFILRVKPNARFVAAWIAFTAVVYAVGKTIVYDYYLLKYFNTITIAGMGILMFIGCPMDDLVDIKVNDM